MFASDDFAKDHIWHNNVPMQSLPMSKPILLLTMLKWKWFIWKWLAECKSYVWFSYSHINESIADNESKWFIKKKDCIKMPNSKCRPIYVENLDSLLLSIVWILAPISINVETHCNNSQSITMYEWHLNSVIIKLRIPTQIRFRFQEFSSRTIH